MLISLFAPDISKEAYTNWMLSKKAKIVEIELTDNPMK